MRMVVVGASGNVGTSVLAALGEVSEVESVLGIARRRPRADFPKVEWAVADVSRATTWRRTFAAPTPWCTSPG